MQRGTGRIFRQLSTTLNARQAYNGSALESWQGGLFWVPLGASASFP